MNCFQGKLEVEKHLKKVEENMKKIRITEIRKQEKEFSKQISSTAKENDKINNISNEVNSKYTEYMKKQEEIKKLTEMKEEYLNSIGEAHKNASQFLQRKDSIQNEKMKFELEEAEKAKQRYEEAKVWMKNCQNEAVGYNEEILNKKKKVFENETKLFKFYLNQSSSISK